MPTLDDLRRQTDELNGLLARLRYGNFHEESLEKQGVTLEQIARLEAAKWVEVYTIETYAGKKRAWRLTEAGKKQARQIAGSVYKR